MNKKGFTLVELLAVIAILAILVIIALPNVLSMFNQAKEDTFATETKEMVKIAQQQYLANFGKYTKYAVSNNGNDTAGTALAIVDCAENTPTASQYCKINKEAGNLTSFVVEFNKADGQVAKVLTTDGTYSFHFPYKDDEGNEVKVYDATKVKDNGTADK